MKKNIWIILAVILGSIGLAILLTSIVWIVADNNYFAWFSKIDLDNASAFGAYISGFVGVFWTGGGAILIFATFKEQQKLSEKQQFESSFFNLLNTYHSIASTTEDGFPDHYQKDRNQKKGRDFFTAVLKELKSNSTSQSFYQSICNNEEIPEVILFHKDLEKKNESSDIIHTPESQIEVFEEICSLKERSKEFIVAQYEYTYRSYQTKLGHYFRFIYNIMKFTIGERKEKYKDEDRYINLIQAQMSNDELGLLFYNAISKYGKANDGEQKFLSWLNDYSFFENIDPDSLIEREHHIYYKTIFKFLTTEERKQKNATVNNNSSS